MTIAEMLKRVRSANLNGQTEQQLLSDGYSWKLAYHKKNGRFGYAQPIEQKADFHTLRVYPKFWLPRLVWNFIFRQLHVQLDVNREAKIDVWLACNDETGKPEWQTKARPQ